MPNASDIAMVSGTPWGIAMLNAVLATHPLLASLEATELEGDEFMTICRTALPTANGFLDLNEGMRPGRVSLEMGLTKAARVGAAITEAVSSTKKWNKRNKSSIGAGLKDDWLTMQMKGNIEAEMQHIERQLFSGRSLDAKGFPGLREITSSAVAGSAITMTGNPEDATIPFGPSVLDVGGSTATTASEVYSICEGDQDVMLHIGGQRGIAGFLDMAEPEKAWLPDAEDATRFQWHWVSNCEGYLGLQVFGSSAASADREFVQYSVRRAMNITEQTDKGVTEKVLDKLIAMHPDGHKPTKFVMTARSQEQLRASKTAATQFLMGIGDAKSAVLTQPLPEFHRGIPIVISRHIGNKNVIEVAA